MRDLIETLGSNTPPDHAKYDTLKYKINEIIRKLNDLILEVDDNERQTS